MTSLPTQSPKPPFYHFLWLPSLLHASNMSLKAIHFISEMSHIRTIESTQVFMPFPWLKVFLIEYGLEEGKVPFHNPPVTFFLHGPWLNATNPMLWPWVLVPNHALFSGAFVPLDTLFPLPRSCWWHTTRLPGSNVTPPWNFPGSYFLKTNWISASSVSLVGLFTPLVLHSWCFKKLDIYVSYPWTGSSLKLSTMFYWLMCYLIRFLV